MFFRVASMNLQKPTAMKKFFITSIFAFFLAGGSALMAQAPQAEYLGLPGDNLNLYAVMETFRESETLEAFERAINDPEYMVNNLDLNGDGYVDYISVNDYVQGNVHHIVLRVALNQSEYQDVAVFVVEKLRDGSATVQLIGDEALYGPNYIIEPHYAETVNPGYRGNVTRPATKVVHTTYYEVAAWPVIVYMSRPVYRPWRSVWYYGYYPSYWSPWRAHYWHYYHGYHYHWHSHYYSYYRPWNTYRCGFYTNYYVASVRRHSPVVVVNINRGTYKNTYSRPDTRKQGEALYAQRSSSSGRVPAGTVRNESSGRTNAGQVSRDANTAGTRSVNAPRNTSSGASARSEGATRTQQESVRRESAPANVSSPARTNSAPASSNTRREATPAVERNEPRSSGQTAAPARTAPATNNRSTAAPASTPSRSAATQSPAPARTAPASNDRSSSAPANVNRSQPAPSREAAPRVSAPAQNTRSSAPAPAVNRSSSNTRSSAPAPAVNRSSGNERSSGSAVRSSAPSRSSEPATRSSSSNERSSNSRSAGNSRNR